jgi:hypothetical protein
MSTGTQQRKLAAIMFTDMMRYSGMRRAALYPERFAQEALGHNSKAVHRAYAKRALMKIPSLEDYEVEAAQRIAPPAL